MWKVLYIAPTEAQAQRIQQLLAESGFLVKVLVASIIRLMKSAFLYLKQRMRMRFCARINFSAEGVRF